MIRNIKTLGLAFIAAMVAMSMTAAIAQGAEVHIETGQKAVLKGEQLEKHKFQITSGAGGPNVQCGQALFEGAVVGGTPQITAQTLKVTGQYTGCTFLGLNATITMNGCKFEITGEGQGNLVANVDVTGCTSKDTKVDPVKKPIEVHVPGCTLTIPEQHNKADLGFTNEVGPPKDVRVLVTVSGITYETHGAACAHQPETVLKHDARYDGQATFRAFVDNGTELATHNGHQFNKSKTLGQVGLVAT